MAPPKKRPPQGKSGQKRPPQGRKPQQARKPAGNSAAKSGAAGAAASDEANATTGAVDAEAPATAVETAEAPLSKSAEERKAKREAARQERLALARKRQQARRRKQILISIVVLVALVAGAFYIIQRSQGRQAAYAAAAREAGCTGIEQFEDEGQRHLAQNEQFDDYKTNPPTSGPHRLQPAPWGSYREAPERETLVHNLEHGGIVVYYKDLPDDQVDQLDEFVDDHADGVISVPDDQIEQPVAITAWRHLQTCEELNLTVIEGFIEDRCNKGPEKVGTTCAGG
ncbi:MAG TPA: DUF3105 domain-containing protein [Actinomycetota bacterium]|nr:DUF3105 domain-containing protein [Actinomycetota bacterium]